MSSPFRIEGPAVISFSGGRTSGYMLRRILDEGLRPDVHILFANTGKEREETLTFVREVGSAFGVRIRWLEYKRAAPGWEVVEPADASRRGEPFEALLAERKFPPNPVMRFCTQELKIRVMKGFMLAQGYEHWTNVVGIRADEPRRVAKMRAGEGRERWDIALPLAEAGITHGDVDAWWKAQPFDLRLKPWEGNCDLCFLKGVAKRRRVMEDRPELAAWWIEQEKRLKANFRADSLSYAALLEATQRQVRMFSEPEDDDLGDCICHEGTQEAA